MANTTAWTSGLPKNTGERVTAAEFNALDDGMVAAITRGGTTSLTSDVTLDGNTNDFIVTDGRILVDDTGSFGYATTQEIVRVQNGTAKLATDWAWNAYPFAYCQTATTGTLVIPVDNAPDGSIITDVSVIFMGNVPSVGPGFAGLPAGMPSFKLYKTSSSAGTSSSLGTATDATAVLATFNAAHTVTLSGLNEIVSHTNHHSYNVEIVGAFGANYVNGLGVLSVFVTFDTQTVKP